VGGDRRILKAHGRAAKRTLDWIEKRTVETLSHPATGTMVRKGNQKMVSARFTHDTADHRLFFGHLGQQPAPDVRIHARQHVPLSRCASGEEKQYGKSLQR